MKKECTSLYTLEERTCGFKGWNTRIIEILDDKGIPKLAVHSALAEWWRVGKLHAEWNKDTVELLVDYLNGWLERVKDLPDEESTETAKRLSKELQKID